MLKRLLVACLALSFGMAMIAGCEANPKTGPAEKTCAKKCDKPCQARMCKCGKKCPGDLYVRCPGGKMSPCCSMKCAKICAAKCEGTTIVNMKCPCGGKGKEEFKKMVEGVEQHYCCAGCMGKS